MRGCRQADEGMQASAECSRLVVGHGRVTVVAPPLARDPWSSDALLMRRLRPRRRVVSSRSFRTLALSLALTPCARASGGTYQRALAGGGCGHEFNFRTLAPIGCGRPGEPANERQVNF